MLSALAQVIHKRLQLVVVQAEAPFALHVVAQGLVAECQVESARGAEAIREQNLLLIVGICKEDDPDDRCVALLALRGALLQRGALVQHRARGVDSTRRDRRPPVHERRALPAAAARRAPGGPGGGGIESGHAPGTKGKVLYLLAAEGSKTPDVPQTDCLSLSSE